MDVVLGDSRLSITPTCPEPREDLDGETIKGWVESQIDMLYYDASSKIECAAKTIDTLEDHFNAHLREYDDFVEYVKVMFTYLSQCMEKITAFEIWTKQLEDELSFRGIDVDRNLKMLFDEFVGEELDKVGGNDGS